MKRTASIILVLLLGIVALFAQATVEKPVLLSSENWAEDSAVARSINEYITAITDENSDSFIPVKDRIAVFDLDGTIIIEDAPFCFEYMVLADYALNSGSPTITPEVKAVAQEIIDASWGEKPSGMSTRQATAGAIAYKGMTMAEFSEMVSRFKETDIKGYTGLKWSDCGYRPMVELVNVLKANGFEVYIVTATERNIVRALACDMLGLEPDHIIGTEYGYMATNQGSAQASEYNYQATDKVVFDGSYAGENTNMLKVNAIVREIGKQPVLAFGNSGGDVAMCIYTITDNKYPSKAFIVIADDEEREYGNTAKALKNAETYKASGIEIISTKDDFHTLFGNDVKKVPVKQ